MTARRRAIDELLDKRERFVDVFNHLGGYDALKFQIGWDLFDAADKDFRASGARDRSDFRRKFGAKTTVKEHAGFVEQIAVPATDFQELPTSEPAFLEIQKKSPKRRPE